MNIDRATTIPVLYVADDFANGTLTLGTVDLSLDEVCDLVVHLQMVLKAQGVDAQDQIAKRGKQ